MIQLFLNGHLVVIGKNSTIKLTKGNSTIAELGDFTLEVTVPLGIKLNDEFFLNWRRTDAQKETKEKIEAVLMLNSKPILTGSAKVTQSTRKEVRLQLVSGKSDFNATVEGVYIDELPLPYVTSTMYRRVGAGGRH